MNTDANGSTTSPVTIYEAYPDHDVLLIEPPRPGETIREFKVRAEDAGDTLFLFLCREAADDPDAQDYVARLNRAIHNIESVRDAFRDEIRGDLAARAASGANARDVTIRLKLDNDWLELVLTYADTRGRRSGSVTSSLRSSEDDERFNAAMDAVESMVLAHACAGIDVTDPRYVEGIRTCIEACKNNLGGGEIS